MTSKKKYTVFMRLPEADIGDPLHWSRVTAAGPRGAVKASMKLYNMDSGLDYEPGDFLVELVVEGWPNFLIQPDTAGSYLVSW